MGTDQPALLGRAAWLGLFGGLLIFFLTLVTPPPAGLSEAGWHTLGLALLMAIWWSTEPVPIAVTAILPLVLMPLADIADMRAAAAPFANPIVYLFFGGFLLSAALSRWGLHRRLAFSVISTVGSGPRQIVLGFMVSSAFLSMWITNTSTTMLMMPVAMSVITSLEEETGQPERVLPFALALLLGTAYAASMGGLGTLIGTAPNALLVAYLSKQHNIDIPFVAWSAIAVPIIIVLVPTTWFLLTRFVFSVPTSLADVLARDALIERLTVREPVSIAERRVAIVLALTAFAWITRPFITSIDALSGLTDSGIAVAAAVSLFLIPCGCKKEPRFLLTWQEAQNIPWHVLLLFGGGLSLASAMDSTGLAKWIGSGLGMLGDLPPFVFLLLLLLTVLLMTELASNTATVAALLPVVAAIAASTGRDLVLVATALTMAASCAFMLPVATPPNALVFSTGRVTVNIMMRAGIWINAVALILVALGLQLLVPLFPFSDSGSLP